MKPNFRVHAVVVGLLFIVTMLLGVVDANGVAPLVPALQVMTPAMENSLLLGVFCVVFMSLGLVAIATTLYPVVQRHSQAIAMTYVGFRIVEAFLLIFGALLYLLLLASPSWGREQAAELPKLVIAMKLNAYQLAMITLGLGSLLLNFSFYRSQVVPRWLSIWGMAGYLLLFLSAVFDLLGLVDTLQGVGALMYIVGGLWEFVAFPAWLFVKGFRIEAPADTENAVGRVGKVSAL